MNKNRLSLEELKELKPSFENPIELVCDDGVFQSSRKNIKITGWHNDRIVLIDNENNLRTDKIEILKHYPSPKKEREKMEFKPYWVDEVLRLLHRKKEGVFLTFSKEKYQIELSANIIPAKGVESVWRYTDDWSVCDGN